MAQVGKLDFQGFVEGRKSERVGGAKEGGHAYSYVSDRNTRSAFEKMPAIEQAAHAAVRFFQGVGKNQLLGHAVRVSPRQFPRIYAVAEECSKALGIATPTVYITNHPQMNAMTFGTNEESVVIVHSALIDHLDDDELRMVIGHEAGHIHNSHVVYLTAMHYLRMVVARVNPQVAELAMLPLAGWTRRAEITCDRAGLLCSKDLAASTRALAKLALGSQKLYAEFNIEEFIQQHAESQDGIGKLGEITASHPWLPKRLLAMRAFSESELYRRHAGLGLDGLSMEQVDEKVHEIIKVVG